jgi:hypothetical protein
MFRMVEVDPLAALVMIAAVYGAIILGALFGLPQLARWLADESSADSKAVLQLVFGVISLAAAVLVLLYEFGALHVTG